jgi:DsbC/DsbD-like thiol-disulfide interchange protein
MRYTVVAFGFALFALVAICQVDAGETSDSKVKASVEAGKIAADGKQSVTITLQIDKGWHLYANPVNHNNDFLNANKTVVKIAAKEKFKSPVRVKYPEGKNKVEGMENYDVYTGTVKIQAEVVRAAADSSPLEISIDVNACNDKVCLKRGIVKLTAK